MFANVVTLLWDEDSRYFVRVEDTFKNVKLNKGLKKGFS